MAGLGRELPEYLRPPVIEVVCGVQFEPLASFKSVHFGEFLQRVRREYPVTEDQPLLAEIFEGSPGAPKAEMFLGDVPPPLRRVFYIDATGNFLLQVQHTRFLANWRKQREEDSYPRFRTAYDRFLSAWATFRSFLQESEIGTPRANQYELSYINHIPEAGERYPVGIEHFVPLFSWRSARAENFLPPPRGASLALRFPLGETKGTLHVSVKHGERAGDRKGVLLLELTARGPAQEDAADMDDWFSLAHEWIVRGFTDLTSHAAHDTWQRRR